MQNDNKIDHGTDLPEIILDYNATKAPANRVNEFCFYCSEQKNKILANFLLLQLLQILQASITL